MVGLLALHERLRTEFDPAVAVMTTLVMYGGTSLFWVMTSGRSMLEAASFAVVALLLFLSSQRRPGATAQAGVWIVVAILPVALRYVASRTSDDGGILSSRDSALFSSASGLLSLTPIMCVALIGTVAYLRRNAMSVLGALSALTVWLLANTFVPASSSADARFANGLLPSVATLAPGLAFLIDRARVRPLVAAAPLVALAVIWNYWLMVQYTVGLLPKDAPIDYAAMVRQQADVHTAAPYVYPFAFPANVWFAWREGVPADRYELLAHEPRRQAIDLRMDREADRFLLDGWDSPGADALGPVQWIGRERATLALPLDLPANHDVDVIITARARLDEPAVNAILAVEINGVEVGRFVVPPTEHIELPIRIPAPAVGRTWRAGYNRLTFVSHGVQRIDPGDQRPLNPSAGRAANRAWPVAIHRIRITPLPTSQGGALDIRGGPWLVGSVFFGALRAPDRYTDTQRAQSPRGWPYNGLN